MPNYCPMGRCQVVWFECLDSDPCLWRLARDKGPCRMRTAWSSTLAFLLTAVKPRGIYNNRSPLRDTSLIYQVALYLTYPVTYWCYPRSAFIAASRRCKRRSVRNLPGTFQRPSRDLRGTFQGPQTSSQAHRVEKPSRDLPGTDLPGTFQGPSSRETFQRPSRDLPGTFWGPSRDLPGTVQGPSRDRPGTFQGPSRDLPGTFQGPSRGPPRDPRSHRRPVESRDIPGTF